MSGNLALLNVNPGHLFNAYRMCSEHFNQHQFNSKNVVDLKKSAIPSLFCCQPVSNEAMNLYDIGWNIREFNEDSSFENIQKNIIDITEVTYFACGLILFYGCNFEKCIVVFYLVIG